MMTVPEQEMKRLAEIFREIVTLSQTNRPTGSQTATVDDSIKSSNTQSASEALEPLKEKQPSGDRSKAENQEPGR